jgi:hypothetical protein
MLNSIPRISRIYRLAVPESQILLSIVEMANSGVETRSRRSKVLGMRRVRLRPELTR